MGLTRDGPREAGLARFLLADWIVFDIGDDDMSKEPAKS
jgi:hypothetical protein